MLLWQTAGATSSGADSRWQQRFSSLPSTAQDELEKWGTTGQQVLRGGEQTCYLRDLFCLIEPDHVLRHQGHVLTGHTLPTKQQSPHETYRNNVRPMYMQTETRQQGMFNNGRPTCDAVSFLMIMYVRPMNGQTASSRSSRDETASDIFVAAWSSMRRRSQPPQLAEPETAAVLPDKENSQAARRPVNAFADVLSYLLPIQVAS